MGRLSPVTPLEILFLVGFWSIVLFALLFLSNTYVRRVSVRSLSEYDLSGVSVRFKTADGLTLDGWKIPGDEAHPWIILCHGMTTNRTQTLGVAKSLNKAGFNLFLFDFRGHGNSRGRITSFGYTEQRDLEAALSFLGQEPDVSALPYGVYALSMGGAVAMMVAGRDDRIGALVVDSVYRDLKSSLGTHLKMKYPFLPKEPFLTLTSTFYMLRFGVWPSRVAPKFAIKGLKTPLFFIQGDHDPRVPMSWVDELADQLSGPKETWIVQGVGHVGAYERDPQSYSNKVVQFFEGFLIQ